MDSLHPHNTHTTHNTEAPHAGVPAFLWTIWAWIFGWVLTAPQPDDDTIDLAADVVLVGNRHWRRMEKHAYTYGRNLRPYHVLFGSGNSRHQFYDKIVRIAGFSRVFVFRLWGNYRARITRQLRTVRGAPGRKPYRQSLGLCDAHLWPS